MFAVEPEMYFASRRWRFELGEENRGAFNGWKVAVVAGAKKSQVIKRYDALDALRKIQ